MTPRASVTIRTAWPVPASRSCTTTHTPGACRAASALTSSRPWPATTTRRCGSSSPAAASACPSMLRPHSECSTFGVREFIRVPSPAARTMTATGRGSLTRQVSSGYRAGICGFLGFRGHRFAEPAEPALSGCFGFPDVTANVFTHPSPAGYRPVAMIGRQVPATAGRVLVPGSIPQPRAGEAAGRPPGAERSAWLLPRRTS